MPVTLSGSYAGKQVQIDTSVDLGYRYPNGLDLRPGSELHTTLLKLIMDRAIDSRMHMEKRFDAWERIDETMTAYIPVDEDEEEVQGEDERKPVSIVVPFSYATLETLLTYQVATFLQEPYFRYEGFSPEDTVGVALLESVIHHQMLWSKAGLALHTLFRDGLKYGFGICATDWVRVEGFRRVPEPYGYIDPLTQQFVQQGIQKTRVESIIFEGNALKNLDPFNVLPDPNYGIHEAKKGEYFGWVSRESYHSLLQREDLGFFNVRYLKGVDGVAYEVPLKGGNRDLKSGMDRPQGNYLTNPIDVTWMYITLIPKDYELSESERPEIWRFAVGAEAVILDARPLDLDHNSYPIAINAPDFDGYSLTPISKLEVVYGLQHTLNWLFNSHIANVRKSLNDMLVVDPMLVNIKDLETPGPGKLIRLRRSAWGRGVKDAVMQLGVTDVTKQHIGDAAYIVEMMQRVSSAVDTVMGLARTSGERVSATEAKGARVGALSRLERAARVTSMMAMRDLGYMLASQTQQLLEEPRYYRIVGRWKDTLTNILGAQEASTDMMRVSPEQLLVDFDVIPRDGSSPTAGDAEVMTQLFQVLATQPELYNAFDLTRIFSFIAQASGAKNVEDFTRRPTPNIRPYIAADADVAAQTQAGNLIPVAGGMR